MYQSGNGILPVPELELCVHILITQIATNTHGQDLNVTEYLIT